MSADHTQGGFIEGENFLMTQDQVQQNFLNKRFSSNIPTEVERRAVANRDPSFKQYRDGIYEEMIDNPCNLYNFFMKNNDIFRKIEDEDFEECVYYSQSYQQSIFHGTLAGLVGTAVINKWIWPRFTNFRFNSFRGVVFVAKWFGGAFLGNRIVHYIHPIHEIFKEKTIKYNFGYEDFNWAMDIYEHAWRQGRLDDLMEQRDNFDWKSIEEN